MSTNDSLEIYILKKLKEIKKSLSELDEKKAEYSEKDYWIIFHRLAGQEMILLMCLTAHDNKYAEQNNKKK